MNVYDRPQPAHSAMTSHGAEVSPTAAIAAPMPMSPMMSDRRRLYVSATTPVGTSQTKMVASIAVPIKISCNGDSSRMRTR